MKKGDGCRIIDYRRCFEWWYFDCDSKSGHSLYLEWHAPVFNCRNRHCILVIRLYTSGKELSQNKGNESHVLLTKVYRYPRSSVIQSTSLCDIRFPCGHILEKYGDYFINIAEKDLSITLCMKKRLPSILSCQESIYTTDDQKEYFSWYVALPKGEAKGEIRFRDMKIDIDGFSYHDHNWGNLNIGKHLDGWIWARMNFNNYTLVCSELSIKNKGKINIAHLIDSDGNSVESGEAKIFYGSTMQCADTRVEVPKALSIIMGNTGEYEARVQLVRKLVTQEFPLSSFGNHRINSLLAILYYFLELNKAPKDLQKLVGRGIYYQYQIEGSLFVNDIFVDRCNGKLEVFTFNV